MSEAAVPQKRKHDDDSSSTPIPEVLPQQTGDELEQMETNLNYNKWMKKIDNALQKNENVNETFESYLRIFKNDGKIWTKYIEHEMEQKEGGELDKKKIEKLFSQSLTKIYDVGLWRLYLKYVQKINADGGEMARSIVLKAFNFAADNVGIDFLESQDLWNDYIRYLNEWQPSNANEAETRIDLTRQVMTRMIQVPSLRLEDDWKLFISFENDTDQAKARKNINDQSPDFMKLRPLSQELYVITKTLKESNKRRHSKRQLDRFAKWIRWEAANKLSLPDEKAKERVNYVYRVSTQFQRFQPEVWYNYVSYLFNEKQSELALETLQNGLILNPESLSLTYQLANYYEGQSDLAKVKETWLQLIRYLTAEYTKKGPEKEKAKDKAKETGTGIDSKKNFARAVSTCYSLLMRQAKRMGTIKDVRSIFSMARKFKGVTWQVYADYSLIEYQSNDVRVAIRSFELAMRHFGKEYDFISAYLDFLISIKDMTNCKKVIELALQNFKDDNQSSFKLFKRYLKIELGFGDTNSIKALERRFIGRFPETTPFDLTVLGFQSDFDSFNVARMTDQYIEPYEVTRQQKSKITKEDEDDNEDYDGGEGFDLPKPLNFDQGFVPGFEPEKKKEPFIVRDEMYNLLRVLPKAEYYEDKPKLFDSKKTAEFFSNLDI
ncbi:DEKNAAC100904 [Brettanomyces naardenensis]|uniref:mRNA 3'-end-processing protein RNA14 n=1 Tax=Brettanomyces naardenensis TaxID=13370 RepID=A0A448YEG1_BRENA|nr:DEKNAAC100904 [Brettanomyces naardenensis]